jgi:hypothetical protein
MHRTIALSLVLLIAAVACAPNAGTRPGGPLPPLPAGVASASATPSVAPRAPDQTRLTVSFDGEGWSIRLPGAWETIRATRGKAIAQQPAAPDSLTGRKIDITVERNQDMFDLESFVSLLRTREAEGEPNTAERTVEIGGRRWAIAERGTTTVGFRAAMVQGRYLMTIEWTSPARSGGADRAAFEQALVTVAPIRPR